MIHGGFLSEKDRKALIALARDGSRVCRVTRRANALVLLDGRLHRHDLFRGIRKRLIEALDYLGLPALGGFDVSGNEHQAHTFGPHWMPHAWIIAPGRRARQVNADLGEWFPATDTVPRPLHTKRFDGDPLGFAYALKPDFARRISLEPRTPAKTAGGRRSAPGRSRSGGRSVSNWLSPSIGPASRRGCSSGATSWSSRAATSRSSVRCTRASGLAPASNAATTVDHGRKDAAQSDRISQHPERRSAAPFRPHAAQRSRRRSQLQTNKARRLATARVAERHQSSTRRWRIVTSGVVAKRDADRIDLGRASSRSRVGRR